MKSRGWIGQVAGGLTFSICLGLLSLGKASAADFSFTTIADTNQGFTSFSVPSFRVPPPGGSGQTTVLGVSAINDNGTVAFFATPDTGTEGIYTNTNGTITEIANINDLESLFTRELAFIGLNPKLDISNQGTVATLVTGITLQPPMTTVDSIITPVSAERLVTILDGSITTPVTGAVIISSGTIINGFDLNDQDELAYSRLSFGGSNQTLNLNIFRPNQPDVNVATAFIRSTNGGSDFSPLANIGTFALNNQSEVTFSAALTPDFTQPNPTLSSGIFRGAGGPITTLIEPSPVTTALDIPSVIDVNDSGDFLFENDGPIQLFNNATGTITTIGGFDAAINNNRTVAFLTGLTGGGEGIFTTSDSGLHEVIATGDSLNGSTVTNLIFSQEGLNNNGQIAFFAQLADGTQGIFRAERVSTPPTSVPEPAFAGGLLVLGTLLLISRPHREKLR
jgi:hypothetical protein